MFTLLTKIFIKNYQNYKDSKVRNDYGTLASVFGIVSNFIICAMKFIVGLLFSIISITADAVNNLADSCSIFDILSSIYVEAGETSKIPQLISLAEKLDSLSKNAILDDLNKKLQ